jgi:ribosomal protein S17
VLKIQETPVEEISTIQLSELTAEQKQEILNRLTKSSYSLSKILAQSVMSMQAKNTIQVQVQNRLHQEQIKKTNNHDKLRAVAAEVLGTTVKIETVINSDLTLPEIKETGDEVQHMLNVFGGQLVDGALEE